MKVHRSIEKGEGKEKNIGETLPHGKMIKVSFQSAISRERLITNKIPLANTFFSPFLTHCLNLNKIGDLTAVTICRFGVDWSNF